MASHSDPPGIKQKLENEMKKAFALSIYFGIWFCAITFMAATALEERPIPLPMFGFALIKAALSAKFMLIAQAAFPIKVHKENGIVGSLFIESIVYIIIILILNYIEAGVYGLMHGKGKCFGVGNCLVCRCHHQYRVLTILYGMQCSQS